MKTRFIFLIIAAVCAVISCSDSDKPTTSSDAISGSGVLTTESRAVASFDRMTLIIVGDVIVTQGATQSVSLTVDDNILPHVTTTVAGDQLTIGFEDGFSARDYDLTVNLTMVDIHGFTLSGVGQIIGTNQLNSDQLSLTLGGVGSMTIDVDADVLNSTLAGVGDFVLSGTAGRHNCLMSGVGDVSAFGLDTDTTDISLGGEGNAQILVSDQLIGSLSGTGSIFYKGSPSIQISITGQGALVDAN